MCIFVGKVKSVRKTRILVAPLPDNCQLTVYENQVTTEGQTVNAMVLPIPSGKNIELVNLMNYPGTSLWDDCESLFPKMRIHEGMGFGGAAAGGWASSETLPVHKVGGYTCSVVPTLADFVRLSSVNFVVPQNIASILQTFYGEGFSFLVCMFDSSVAGHPIAYTSARLPSGACFIPTRHAHGGDAPYTQMAEAIHTNVFCDGCGTTPIRGTRWKSLERRNFDLCHLCFNKQAPHQTQVFARLAVPISPEAFEDKIQTFLSFDQGFRSYNGKMIDDDHFDHTLYLVNAVLAAPPSRYTEMSPAKEDTRNVIKLRKYVTIWPANSSVIKVDIVGNYPNADYKCVPLDF